jgi:hypothetical protein
MDYQAALAATADRTARCAPAGADETALAADAFRQLFAEFTPTAVPPAVTAAYAEDVWFNDTLKTIEGRAGLVEYLTHSASLCDDFGVDVHEARGSDGDFFVRWTMRIKFKKFRRGVWQESIGISHLRFDADGRIILHQDYWDAAGGLFEMVPVLGWAIRKIKQRV